MKASTLPIDRETGMIRLYAWVMIVTVGLAVGAALLATRTPPQYSATAEVLISPTITTSGSFIEPSMPTEQRVATSADVIGNAAAKLGVPSEEALAHLSVTVPVDTKILVMSYTDDSPAAALAGAKAFADTYLRARNPADGKNPVASLVSPPERPSTPVGANYPVILGAAVVAGLLVGFGVARAWDRVRGRIRTVADAERCANLDALVVTPRLPRKSIDRHPRFMAGRSQLTSLAARVLGQVEGGQQSSLLVTGAATDCGSTAVAATTAVALARMGRVVVLVTADDEVVARMSRDRDPKRKTGTSRDLWPDARPAEQEGLHLVSVAEWDGAGVAAARLTNLLPELHQRLPEALIVIDGPPAWCSAGIALRVDKILLVVALGRGSRKSLATAVQALDHCAEKMMGLVITPRGGRRRPQVGSIREWAARQVRRVVFRVAPPAMDPEPESGHGSAVGATSPPPVWTDQKTLVNPRASAAKKQRNGNVARRPKPKPNAEPTSSVMS